MKTTSPQDIVSEVHQRHAERERKAAELQSTLAQFIGTDQWWNHWTQRAAYTDGVKYLADEVGAHWLIDLVVSWQLKPKVAREPFQVWTLKVNEDRTAVAECWDDTPGESNRLARQEIEYTDFPLEEIRLYFCDGVLLLPSEY